jgi:uncharacterized protein YfdQ (DUF2303 family)
MGEPIQPNLVVEIERMAKAAVAPQFKQYEDGSTYAVFNDGRVQPIMLDAPRRKTGEMQVGDLASLIAYVQKHKEAGTLILVGWDGPRLYARATIDHHESIDAGWRNHACVAKVPPSPAWVAWLEKDRADMGQAEFATWLEDHLVNVVEPTAADMLETVKTLEATQGASFRGAVRLHNGDRAIHYQQTTEAKAGETGQLVIPRQMVLRMPLILGGPVREFTARFKYRVVPGGVALRYEIEQLQELKQQTLDEAMEHLREAFPDVPVLLGAG